MARTKTVAVSEEDEFTAQVVELRDGGATWAQVAEEMGCGQPKVMMAALKASIPVKDRVKFTDDDDLAAQVVELRENEQLSWGVISARSGVGEGKLKRLFEEASGTAALGHRIGKGGRFPAGHENGDAPAKAPKAAKASKATKAAPAAPKEVTLPDKNTPLAEYTLPQLQLKINGKTITVDREEGRQEKIAVKNVKSCKNGDLVFVAKDGKTRTVLVVSVRAVSR